MEDYYLYNEGSQEQSLQEVVSVGKWILILVGVAIPIVNVILMIILITSNPNKNVKNFSIAALIWVIVSNVVLFIAFGSVFYLIISYLLKLSEAGF